LWAFDWFVFSQSKVLAIALLRLPEPAELRLPWGFNPSACFAFYGKLFLDFNTMTFSFSVAKATNLFKYNK
jgi:hypothetical protein